MPVEFYYEAMNAFVYATVAGLIIRSFRVWVLGYLVPRYRVK